MLDKYESENYSEGLANLMGLAGLPTAVHPEGKERTTTDPAPTIVSLPMVILLMILTPVPQ